jgi:protein-L-isoaspartate(D-aspartate) O-methyltransferase
MPSTHFRFACIPILLAGFTACSSMNVASSDKDPVTIERERMVERHIKPRGIRNPAVLDAMRSVPRHLLVPEVLRQHAYADRALPIGYEQTISQPYIVALMTELSGAKAGDKVFEVGTGSGYQAAILAALGAEVFTIEIVPELAKRAQEDLAKLGYDSVQVRAGDGYAGWPEEAPFDAILVTAAPETVPPPLLEQLKVGGRLVIPVGGRSHQELRVITRSSKGYREERVLAVRFVPMTGKAETE